MKIQHLDFKNFVFGQAGVQGFFGEKSEHPHHLLYQFIPGFSFKNMVFVAKTITSKPRFYPANSNTELRKEYKLKRFFPKSIWVSLRSFIGGYMLNAVGLANPGACKMFSYNKWQQREKPFMLSFMPTENTLVGKIKETEIFCNAFIEKWQRFGELKFALQVNFSCPNTGHNEKQDPAEIIAVLKVIREMIPGLILIPKFNLSIEPEVIVAVKPYCEAFCLTNTLGFGEKQPKSWWKKFFPKLVSPLTKYFGEKFKGGLSGKPLFALLVEWIERMEKVDDSIVMIAGGGIFDKKDILKLSQFKIVKGIALGSVATLRPWKLQLLINYGNKLFKD